MDTVDDSPSSALARSSVWCFADLALLLLFTFLVAIVHSSGEQYTALENSLFRGARPPEHTQQVTILVDLLEGGRVQLQTVVSSQTTPASSGEQSVIVEEAQLASQLERQLVIAEETAERDSHELRCVVRAGLEENWKRILAASEKVWLVTKLEARLSQLPDGHQ